jgi:hypothetical protein
VVIWDWDGPDVGIPSNLVVRVGVCMCKIIVTCVARTTFINFVGRKEVTYVTADFKYPLLWVSIMNVAETNANRFQVQQYNHTMGQNKMKEERDLIEINPILLEVRKFGGSQICKKG